VAPVGPKLPAVAVLLLSAIAVARDPLELLAVAVLLLVAKAKLPVPFAAAALLLNATARPEPVEVAVLLPKCTSVFPPAEIAKPPLVVCCVELAPVDDELAPVDGVAHAVGAPTASARIGAPVHTATAPKTVFFNIVVPFPAAPLLDAGVAVDETRPMPATVPFRLNSAAVV
jgi:hypothetical protein